MVSTLEVHERADAVQLLDYCETTPQLRRDPVDPATDTRQPNAYEIGNFQRYLHVVAIASRDGSLAPCPDRESYARQIVGVFQTADLH